MGLYRPSSCTDFDYKNYVNKTICIRKEKTNDKLKEVSGKKRRKNWKK